MELSAEFKNQMMGLLGVEQASLLCDTIIGTQAVTSIRINPAKVSTVPDSLPAATKVPWTEYGYYLDSRPQFTLDPLFHAGCYYVQEASSMFLCKALKDITCGPVTMLDLCAAPGGKTTLAASVLPKGSVLLANEIQRSRAQILAENAIKWGNDNVLVSCNTPAQIGSSGLQFDIVLTDVPCSGEGMFRKDEVAIQDWSLQNVEMCAARQKEILKDIWPAVKPGGYLIYSTCTFNSHEDEENVEWIRRELGAAVISVGIEDNWGIIPVYQDYDFPAYHFMQHVTKGEGFFLAVLKKDEGYTSGAKLSAIKEDETARHLVRSNWDCRMEKDKDFFIARPAEISETMKGISDRLYCLVKGIEVGSLKGKDIIPCHSLALSGNAHEEIPRIELDRESALEYLHGDVLRLDCQLKGFVMVTYQGHPLGFVKNLGSRANNCYPQQWRIRSSIK